MPPSLMRLFLGPGAATISFARLFDAQTFAKAYHKDILLRTRITATARPEASATEAVLALQMCGRRCYIPMRNLRTSGSVGVCARRW